MMAWIDPEISESTARVRITMVDGSPWLTILSGQDDAEKIILHAPVSLLRSTIQTRNIDVRANEMTRALLGTNEEFRAFERIWEAPAICADVYESFVADRHG